MVQFSIFFPFFNILNDPKLLTFNLVVDKHNSLHYTTPYCHIRKCIQDVFLCSDTEHKFSRRVLRVKLFLS